MAKLFRGSILLVTAILVACGDDDSDFATRPSGNSSSSIKNVTPQSSDSETSVSSSSSVENQRESCDDENCLMDDRDGQTYKTVKIGDQVWMAENLNFKVDSSFCFKHSESLCDKYGRFYRWAAAVDKPESECGYGNTCSLTSEIIQGVCPSGWHLPNNTEWETLFATVGGGDTGGKALKSTTDWIWSTGTDEFGFSALPAGDRYADGTFFDNEGADAFFWSASERNGYSAYTMCLNFEFDFVGLASYGKSYGYSVRCVKDEPGPLE